MRQEVRIKFPNHYDVPSEHFLMGLKAADLTNIKNIEQHGIGGTFGALSLRIPLKYSDSLASIIRDDSDSAIKPRLAYYVRLKLSTNSHPEGY